MVRWLLVADGFVVALYGLDVALGHPSWKFARLVNLDGEANLPTWYSSSKLLILAILLAVFARSRSYSRRVSSWVVYALPAAALLLSLDEVAQIHEWIGKRSDALLTHGTRAESPFPKTGIWMFVAGIPFVVVVAALWRRFVPHLGGNRRVAGLYVLGFTVFAVSALGIELLSNLTVSGGPWAVCQVTGEEAGEMIGETLMIWATIELLRDRGDGLRWPDS